MPLSDDAVDDVLSVVRSVRRWQLTPDQWTVVSTQLEHLGTAFRAGDEVAAYAAIGVIDECGPTRLAAIPAERPDEPLPEARTEPPPEVVELLNTLVHHPPQPGPGLDASAG